MGRSLALAVYLGLSARAEGLARRRLSARLSRNKEDAERLEERMGHASAIRPAGPLAWFHAASVGELLSLVELLRRLVEERPDVNILVTTGTVTSAQMFAKRAPEGAIHQFAPLDARPAVNRFLAHWRPDLAVWTESELWPALMYETAERGIPMLLVNARMSARSYSRWQYLRGMARSLLQRFTLILAQEDSTATYLKALGAPADRVVVSGTLKEGAAALPCSEAERSAFSAALDGRPVWLAASTHAGEEGLVAMAHSQVMRAAQRALLIIAPRHPERGPKIAEELETGGFKVRLRSRGEDPEPDTQIYIADTLGEMGLWYRIAPVSFVGGSLAAIGGHNPFEPAALGSAILSGPSVSNFDDVFRRLSDAGAVRLVQDEVELAAAVIDTLSPEVAARMAHAAWEMCSAGAEVTDQVLTILQEKLPGMDH